MSDKVVCLGCGLIVDQPGDWGCSCPPPSIAPRSGAKVPQPSGPYRSLPTAAACPRCTGRLLEACFHDATVLDCADCGGLFLPRQVIDAVLSDDQHALRLAFPQRDRVPEPVAVRYLMCPCCSGRMNRENFGSMSGVIVDVCMDDGIWFDAGEINAVIAFVEKGGLELANMRKEQRHAHNKARTAQRLLAERTASAQASHFNTRKFVRPTAGPVLEALSRWFVNN